MLGVPNIGMETPLEFSHSNNRTSLLFQKVIERKRYNNDGRVFINSEIVEHMTAQELWEKLIVRTVAINVAPSIKDAEVILRRVSTKYRQRLSRPPVQSIAEEELANVVGEELDSSGKEEEEKCEGKGERRRLANRRGKQQRADSGHKPLGKRVSQGNAVSSTYDAHDLQPQRPPIAAPVSKSFTGAINVEIGDNEDVDFAEVEEKFVTLIDVNDALLKELLLEEHRRLDEEEKRLTSASEQKESSNT